MNLKTFLYTAISLTLPAAMLCAQDNATPQEAAPPQPPNAPQGLPPARDGGPQRPDGARPDGQQRDGARPDGPQRDGARPDGARGGGPGDGRHMGPSLFDLLDTNHDGVIDAEELKNAGEVLKKMDRNGDGKLTREELFPQGAGRFMRRPQSGNGPADGPGANEGRNPQPPNPGPQNGPGGAPQGRDGGLQGPQAQGWQQRQQFAWQMRERAQEMQRRWAQNGPQFGPEGRQDPRGPRPQNEGPQNQGPQAQESRHHHGSFGPNPEQRYSQNGPSAGPQEPWPHHHHPPFGPGPQQGWAQNGPQFGPQGPWMHHHHHGEFGPDSGPGFAPNNGPQFGAQGPGMSRWPGFRGGSQGPYAMGPRMEERRPEWRGPGAPDCRRFSREPQPQDGRREFRPPPGGAQQGGPRPGMEYPRPEQRRPDQSGANPPPNPGGPPQPESRRPVGPGPSSRNPADFYPRGPRFRPPFSDNSEPGEGGAAGPQGEPSPEFQPAEPPAVEPAASDAGRDVPLPVALGDVI